MPSRLLLWVYDNGAVEQVASGGTMACAMRCSDTVEASSRRSFRMPASTNRTGANLRSNRRRFASPPAVYRSFGRTALPGPEAAAALGIDPAVLRKRLERARG